MSDQSCPGCGEDERLHGRTVDDDIEVTCATCGSTWLRGTPHCRECGRAGGVTLPQRMTRHPRGTLLAVVGVRDTLLCPTCDRAVVDAALNHNDLVPEGYVSRFLRGVGAGPAAAATNVATSPAKPRRERRADTSVRVALPEPTPRPAPARVVDPTVRQATEAFLEATDEQVDSVVLVLLGTLVGASTRVSALDDSGAADRVAEWLERTWGPTSGERRAAAAATLRHTFGHWLEQGWLAGDALLEALGSEQH